MHIFENAISFLGFGFHTSAVESRSSRKQAHFFRMHYKICRRYQALSYNSTTFVLHQLIEIKVILSKLPDTDCWSLLYSDIKPHVVNNLLGQRL